MVEIVSEFTFPPKKIIILHFRGILSFNGENLNL